MSIDTFAARFADLEIFRGLSPGQLGQIAHAAERIVYRDGQEIIRRGTPGDGACLIFGGRAETLADPELGIEGREIAEGSLVGEMAMLIEHEYAVTVVARGQVRALRLSRPAMHRLMADDPDLADHFVQRISSRLTRIAVDLRRLDQMLALAAEAAPA